MKIKHRILLISAISVVIIASAIVFIAYSELKQKAWVQKTAMIYIHPDETYTSLSLQLLDATGSDTGSFWAGVARHLTHLDEKVNAHHLTGAYRLTEGMSVLQAMRVMSLRMQTPIKLTFIGTRTVDQLAARMADCIAADSASVLNAIYSPAFLAECQCDSANVGCFILPDTYEVYWDISPERLTQRLLSEYRKFWNDTRLAKAAALDITPQQASIICSIAEEETADQQERGVVARLYHNRLKRGMLLQADPTVKFAVGDFTLRRILNKHLEVESPYNTYRVVGLPPGPIRVVEKRTIDALLNSQPHPYLYMCAKEDFSGHHNFATTLSEHNRNAAKYHNALRKAKIK